MSDYTRVARDVDDLEMGTGKERFLFLQSARLLLKRMSDKISLIFYFKNIWLQFPCKYMDLSKQDSVFITSTSQWENVRLFVCVCFLHDVLCLFLYFYCLCSAHAPATKDQCVLANPL